MTEPNGSTTTPTPAAGAAQGVNLGVRFLLERATLAALRAVQLIVLGAGAVALAGAGQFVFAVVFAAVIVLNAVLLHRLDRGPSA